jgi:hypothetical protein
MGRMLAVPLLCELYPGFCFTTEENARKNLSRRSRNVPIGTIQRVGMTTLREAISI